MSPVALNLLVRRDGAENDFCELSTIEGTVCDAPCNISEKSDNIICSLPDDLQRLLDNGHRKMRPIVHKPGDVILRHFGELFLEYTLQSSQYDEAVARIVVVDDSEFDFSIALFDNRWLYGAEH